MQKGSVNKLLNKKVWTGEDVGRAILIRLVDDMARPDQPPTITQADVNRMLESITTNPQRSIYLFFSELYDTLYDLGQLQRTYRQMFKHGNFLEQSILCTFIGDNELASRQLKTPVLITPEHYEQLKVECLNNLKNTRVDYWCAFHNVLLHITDKEIPSYVQYAWDECAEEPITNENVLSYLEEQGLPEEYNTKQAIFYTDALDYYFENPADEEAALILGHYLEFREDYPKLTKCIDKYLHTFPAFKDIRPVEDCFNVVVSFQELAEQGFPPAKEKVEMQEPSVKFVKDYLMHDREDCSFEYKVKLMCGGIALTLEGEEAETPMDFCLKGEETAIYAAADIDEAIPSIQMAEYSLKALYAFNAIIDTLIKCYRLDVLEPMKNDMQELEEDVEVNSSLLRSLTNAVWGTEEEKERKRQIYETAFPLINVEDLKPAQDRIEELEKLLEGVSYSTGSSKIKRNAVAHYMLYLMGEREELAYGK